MEDVRARPLRLQARRVLQTLHVADLFPRVCHSGRHANAAPPMAIVSNHDACHNLSLKRNAGVQSAACGGLRAVRALLVGD